MWWYHLLLPINSMNFKWISYLQSLTKTAEMACALDCMARIVSLLFPAQKPPASTDVTLEVESAAAAMGFDCSMMVHSASCTMLSSWSHNWTGFGKLESKKFIFNSSSNWLSNGQRALPQLQGYKLESCWSLKFLREIYVWKGQKKTKRGCCDATWKIILSPKFT